MVYEPKKDPEKALFVISVVCFFGILGGYTVGKYVTAVALLYWMQYTGILSYLQFKRHTKKRSKGLFGILLNPQIRFFLFELLAVIGIFGLILMYPPHIGAAVLLIWWGFSLIFYFHYMRKK